MKSIFSTEELAWLRSNYPTLGPKERAAKLGKAYWQVKQKANRMHLIYDSRHKFTNDERELLRREYATTPTNELAQRIGCPISTIYNQAAKLGLHKAPEFVAEIARVRSLDPNHGGRAYRFKPGQAPANKGKKQTDFMSAEGIERTKPTRFQKGHIPPNYRPVGSERINVDGYVEVKVREGLSGWRLKHRVVWEEAYGVIPKGHNIQFRDGNRLNCTLENLYIISRPNQLRAQSIYNYPPELQDVIRLKGRVKREINKQKKNNNGKQ